MFEDKQGKILTSEEVDNLSFSEIGSRKIHIWEQGIS
jgi:hypothetical protein